MAIFQVIPDHWKWIPFNLKSECLLLFSHSVVSDSASPWTAACQASLSFTVSQSLHKLMSTESVMLSNHLILWCPLLFLPSSYASIRVLSNELALCIRRPKYWSFSLSISPSKEYSGLISSGIDGLNLFAVQGTLKSLLQKSKASIFWHSILWSNSHIHTWLLGKL